MPNYILLYKGPATDMSQFSEEQVGAQMAMWGAWAERVGADLVDMGSPFAESSSVVDNGSDGTPAEMSGYGIVKADDMAGAKAHCDGHPFISEDTGDFSIDIFELVDM